MGLIRLQSSSLPSGSVLQVVQGIASSQVVHTTSYSDTGLSASITPTLTSSKILIKVDQHCYVDRYGGSLKLLRNTTDVWEHRQAYGLYLDPNVIIRGRLSQSFNYLDSPSSTSQLTYKTQARQYLSSGAFRTQDGGYFDSFITLMEIAG